MKNHTNTESDPLTAIQNKQFYFALKNLTDATSKLILEGIKAGKISIKLEQIKKLTIEDDDSFCTVKDISKPSVRQLMSDIKEQIKGLHEFKECVKLMQEDEGISKHLNVAIGTYEFRSGHSAEEFIEIFIFKIISSYLQNNKINEKNSKRVFDEAYVQFEQIFYLDNYPKITVSPLCSFSCDVEIELEKGLKIRKLDCNEQAKILEDLTLFHISNKPLIPFQYVIEIKYSTKKVFGPLIPGDEKTSDDVDVREKIGKVVTALRLFKENFVGNSFIRTEYNIDLPYAGTTFSGNFSDNHFGVSYILKKSEVGDFKKIWEKVEASPDTVALRRFNYFYGRENLEDRLIDMMIAFEALYLQGDKGGPSSGFVISVACSVLIGQNDEERKKIKETMLQAYSYRNFIVHGSKFERYKKDPKTSINRDLLQELVSEVGKYLRESIKKLL